jgi:hypothetical protein
MSCHAHVIGCVVLLIGNVLVNNDLVNVIEGTVSQDNLVTGIYISGVLIFLKCVDNN